MCGIAGYWSPQTRGHFIEEMLGTIIHRGPDDSGVWRDVKQNLVLGQRRLAIIDLSPGGHQPMLSESSKTVITFNGEIYNFLELREELESKGVRFCSHSDTEVLLKGYEIWGTDVLGKLVGMFAFALWDADKQELFLARDRAGEKPLYYAQQGTHSTSSGQVPCFAFASEIQALTVLPWADTTLDREAVALYLNLQYVPAPYSIYQGIRKLPPAHAMTVSARGVKTWRYWDPVQIASQGSLNISEEEALGRLETLLRQAVKGQMIADVPLGAFLSGGIDSSTVVSMMTELSGQKVKTFTIGFDSAKYNEAEHAKTVADYLGTDHTCEYLGEKDSLELIPQLPHMYGEPFADPSALPTHLVSRVARKHVTVSLSGDGGDEAFGGYHRYNDIERYAPWLAPLNAVAPLAKPVLEKLPGRLNRLSQYVGRPTQDFYRSFFGQFKDSEVAGLTGTPPKLTDFERAWNTPLSLRRRAMLSDMLGYMPEGVLVKVDRAAMAISLETRAPLLDHRVLEFSLRLPQKFIQDKYLLRRLAYQRIPQHLLDRPKQGFGVPLEHWFRKDLKHLLTDALSSGQLKAVGIENTALVQKILDEHLKGQNHAARLWSLLVLSLWYEAQKNRKVSAALVS
jgi:asparagine synthase (glutamine-hydrolysing)